MEDEDAQWNLHTKPYKVDIGVALNNTLYLFASENKYSTIQSTSLPLESKPHFTEDKNMEYLTEMHCIVQIDNENVALIGGKIKDTGFVSNIVTVYNLRHQATSNFAPMKTPRYRHACIKVDIGGKPWLVVTGGINKDTRLSSSERMNLDGSNAWETMNDLNVERSTHQMIIASKDTVIALGGYNDGGPTKAIEALNWETKTWKQLEESLIKENYAFSIVEVPASLLGCRMNTVRACPELPEINHGNWSCNNAKTDCTINCDSGYVSLLKHATCSGGIWSKINKIQCKPSVWLAISDHAHSFYHPTIGNPTCSKPLPNTIANMEGQVTFVYDTHLYTCGGFSSMSQCYSINLENDEFQWKTHTMYTSRFYYTSVTLKNKLYFIGGHKDFERKPLFTTLPLAEEATFIPVQNFSYQQQWGNFQCVAKLNEHSFVTIWTDGRVSKYDATEQKETELARLNPKREGPGCVMVTVSGKDWIVVSGGYINGYLSTTERLDLSSDTATWENMEAPLKTPRYRHKMMVADGGIAALGGSNGRNLDTVEVLNWTTQTWSYVETRLPTRAQWRSPYIVEVPASTFGCQTMPAYITGCKGQYAYNQEYPEGTVKALGTFETCHSACEEEENCKTWTWNAEDKECRLQRTLGTLRFKQGVREVCKPKCYSVIGPANGASSMEYCNGTESEPSCFNLVQKEPNEFEKSEKILLCHKEGKSESSDFGGGCEEIDYGYIETACSLEPAVVANSIKKKMRKRRFTRNVCCGLSWG